MEVVAGVQSEAGVDTTLACLTMEERPLTPPAIRRWRKSHYAEPGMRVIHPGLQQDVPSLDSDRVFGNGRASASDHVGDVWKHPGTENEFAAKKLADMEKIYESSRREPLGRSYRRGHDLPPISAFGVSTKLGDVDAKQLVNQPSIVDDDEAKLLYAKSHGYQDPGQQTRRGYSWKKDFDPSTHRFGVGSGSQFAMNGASHGAAAALLREKVEEGEKIVESVAQAAATNRRMELGRGSRLVSFDANKVFGKKTVRGDGEWDARQCVLGEGFEVEEEDPGDDLGKSLTPGFRNIDTNTVFGVPSIRSDTRTRRSVADGDSREQASTLLRPPALKGQAFGQRRTKSESWDVMRAVRPDIDEETFDRVYSSAADSGGHATLRDLHLALLRYPRRDNAQFPRSHTKS